MRCLMLPLLGVAFCFFARNAFSAEVTVERSPHGVVVKIDGQLFTEYLERSGTKPILWPIIGPTGKEMTREYPMRDHAAEIAQLPDDEARAQKGLDHVHQRSFWFTHGNVNGSNFWAEPGLTKVAGTIKHVKFLKIASGKPAIIVTQDDWIGHDGKKICEDQRTLRFDTDGDARWIDFDIVVKATNGPVTFADDKEGTFGLRLAHSMSVDAKQGGKIINSHGQTDADAWGKAAPWVDYHGPVDSKIVGVSILNHPTSFRFPTYWHVRPYGLFAANPFGLHEFTKAEPGTGEHKLAPGETMTLRYRVLFHRGDEKEGRVAEAFEKYVKEVK